MGNNEADPVDEESEEPQSRQSRQSSEKGQPMKAVVVIFAIVAAIMGAGAVIEVLVRLPWITPLFVGGVLVGTLGAMTWLSINLFREFE